MRKLHRYTITSILLIVLSMLFYLFQIFYFRRTADTFFYMIQDFAFIPIQILIVTIIVNELLLWSEKQQTRKKIYMVIELFFSAFGTQMMRHIFTLDGHFEKLKKEFDLKHELTNETFANAMRAAKHFAFGLTFDVEKMQLLQTFLTTHRTFFLAMLGNPNLQEHTTFSDLLLAISHLTEELTFRQSLTNLPKADQDHLLLDIERVYRRVLVEWLLYVKH
ncbi:MAG: hypothetical protein H7Y41_00815, partial [Hyphomonadaceae bacterium]|nr:hypothetical protein [Clostridia bacterium]